jgi:hypothetical protein
VSTRYPLHSGDGDEQDRTQCQADDAEGREQEELPSLGIIEERGEFPADRGSRAIDRSLVFCLCFAARTVHHSSAAPASQKASTQGTTMNVWEPMP